ncbi:MAG: hypothetical protein NT165_03375 [Candidatus Falkowbacteria bacterium]|nr:hypothetical protein [Candidatus Falkowbacteria bacterium]
MKRKKVIIVISLSIIAIGIYFYLNTGTSQNMTVQKENRITKDTLLEELLQPLDFLYETFSSRINDPYIGVEAGQLVRKYQEIRQEMLYLDSVSGLQIDFIGMTHNDWMSDDKKVMISQDSISSLIHSKKWDIIGHESYDKFGFVTKSDIFSTALAEMKLYSADRILRVKQLSIALMPIEAVTPYRGTSRKAEKMLPERNAPKFGDCSRN